MMRFQSFLLRNFSGSDGSDEKQSDPSFFNNLTQNFSIFHFQLFLEKSAVFIVIATIVRYIFLLNIIKNNTKNTILGQMGQINPKTFSKKSFRI